MTVYALYVQIVLLRMNFIFWFFAQVTMLRNTFLSNLVVNPSFHFFFAHFNQKKHVHDITNFILHAMKLRANYLKD